MFGLYMDITIAYRKLKVNVISQGQVSDLGLEMEICGKSFGLTSIFDRGSFSS